MDPKPEEEPKIPCNTDDDCKIFQDDAICAEWMGAKDCTIPCTQESDCDAPAAFGVRFDFADCQTDEANTDRMACLPREECFSNPTSCVEIDDGVPGGGFP